MFKQLRNDNKVATKALEKERTSLEKLEDYLKMPEVAVKKVEAEMNSVKPLQKNFVIPK